MNELQEGYAFHAGLLMPGHEVAAQPSQPADVDGIPLVHQVPQHGEPFVQAVDPCSTFADQLLAMIQNPVSRQHPHDAHVGTVGLGNAKHGDDCAIVVFDGVADQ
jgi:hypothetical protein